MKKLRKVLIMLASLVLMVACTPEKTPPAKNSPQFKNVSIPSAGDISITGALYGDAPNIVVLSNMDPNNQESWEPLIHELVARKYTVLSYRYNRSGTERLKDLLDVLAFIRSRNFQKILLIGACRGGVISLQAVANQKNSEDIIAVAALAVPIEYDGITFYSKEELSSITIPKLLINSEEDDSARDTREIFKLFTEPKTMFFHSGNAHGTDIFSEPDNRELLIDQLANFVSKNMGA